MRKKVFFILSSFSAGGSERVFWLLCQNFNKVNFDVTVVLLNTQRKGFTLDLPGVRIIDLNSIKASRSFIPLLKLLRREMPYAVYATGGHVNILVSFVSLFCKIPFLIARGTNIPEERNKFSGIKSKVISQLGTSAFRNFNFIICQSKEMLSSWSSKSIIDPRKLVVIPNPVLKPEVINSGDPGESKKLIIVARLSAVKGHNRLIDIFQKLPDNYSLTIAGGDGGLGSQIQQQIGGYNLGSRVEMLGQIGDVCNLIASHHILVLSSYTEAFPNVVLEALSVGTPVVTFRVGAVSDFIVNEFNGYIVEQGDSVGFRECIIKACNRTWDHQAIADDVQARFSIHKVVKQYEDLIGPS